MGSRVLRRRSHHRGPLGPRQGRGGSGLRVHQLHGQGHCRSFGQGMSRPTLCSGPSAERTSSISRSSTWPYTQASRSARFGLSACQRGLAREEGVLHHPFRIHAHRHPVADPALDHRQQPRPQPHEGAGEDGLPGQVRERRLGWPGHAMALHRVSLRERSLDYPARRARTLPRKSSGGRNSFHARSGCHGARRPKPNPRVPSAWLRSRA